MRESSPRAPFDQGLFLTHLNKGKELYDLRKFEEAEAELEEAYLLRPRDQKVLNLLGLVYFKQDKYEKAEEVYRKLVAESPDAHTLFYNLGLIYFKLSRLEEAESAFMKALELTQGNPKINFYLGSIYERLHRFQDAIFQYRQAGANIMVRRVEDKIAATIPPKRPPGPIVKKPEDTAEFKARDIREALQKQKDEQRTEPNMAPSKTLQPVSDLLMADGVAPRATDATARFRSDSPEAQQRFPEIISFPRGVDTTPPRERPPGPEVFRFLENNLMEIDFSGKVFIKQGTIYSYSGNLTFWVKDKRPGGVPALVIITGNGKVILTDKGREITFMHVEEETVYVEPTHLLACEETLTPRYVSLAETGPGPEVIALDGRGMVALSVASKPLPLSVTADLPVSVPSTSVITWSGTITPRIVDDRQLYEVMLPADTHAGPLVRLEGTGRVLVEQSMKG
jgi:Flp pilus assembly protein TadD